MSLPPTPVITLRPNWAVVREPYLRLRVDARREAGISGHLRRGEVAEITAISPISERVDGQLRYWFFLEGAEVSGWALDDALAAYGSEYRARDAAERLGARGR
ncbi:MAG: hypothetical protein ACOC7V_16430 [Spirochaetota bacterium]